MIRLYSFPTPNGDKLHILLEELGLDYDLIPVDILKGEQFDEAFLSISPNNKIPAMVDPDGPDGKPLALFESGAMMLYLAEKEGAFLPASSVSRYRVMQWLMFQMGGVGPMLGQAHHFLQYAPVEVPYAMERYSNEAHRLYRVMEKQLTSNEWLAGEEYSLADMATWPWLQAPDKQGVDIDEFPALKAWHERIGERPAVQKAIGLMAELRDADPRGSEASKHLFGQR